MMPKIVHCMVMQIFSPGGGAGRHSGIHYCGGCWSNECLYGGTGSCTGPLSTDAGVVPNQFHLVRVTVNAEGTEAKLYLDVGSGWVLTSTMGGSYSAGGKIAFNEQCADIEVDYVWAMEGVLDPTG
jgi:hypothetical protein